MRIENPFTYIMIIALLVGTILGIAAHLYEKKDIAEHTEICNELNYSYYDYVKDECQDIDKHAISVELAKAEIQQNPNTFQPNVLLLYVDCNHKLSQLECTLSQMSETKK